MTENKSEPQLADQVRIELLNAIGSAAEAGHGENARYLAEAYAIVTSNAPTEAKPGPSIAGGSPLAGRR
ncbi:hypothetical protein GCM10022384_07350 [Streptomyces marokkonensis]|uniref:Uncharacterized protein n=1 Tax=Streptomyces marokkonensis TaxID=324855 RepID=A0ABP7P137_9ACTN